MEYEISFERSTGMFNDRKCKLTSTIAEVLFTSLNSHSAGIYSGTKYSCLSTVRRSGPCTPTNRTDFLAWPNHQIGFALGAFGGFV